MDDIRDKLHDTTINENSSIEKKPIIHSSWLDQFTNNNNENNDHNVSRRQESKSNPDNFNQNFNSFANNISRGRGRGLNLLKQTMNQNEPIYNNSNEPNHKNTFTSSNDRVRDSGFLKKLNHEENSRFEDYRDKNSRDNYTAAGNCDRDQDSFKNGENESFESGKNKSFNNHDGNNFASGHRGHRQGNFYGSREKYNTNFNNHDDRVSGHRHRERGNYHGNREMFKEQFNSNNTILSGNDKDSYRRRELAKVAGPKKEYIPPDIESNVNIDGVVAGQNFDKYDTIEVKVSGTDPPKRLTSFHDSGLREILLRNLSLYNFSKLTPIQNYSIPIIMAGRDLMASAQTGSGKTAAYVLPILNNLLSQRSQLFFDGNHCEPHVIIIAPTRELTTQINDCIWKFSKGTNIKCRLLYGGVSREYQKSKLLESGVHTLSATPGRLLDFIENKIVNFSSVKFVVLDEADKMLNMGFKRDIEQILKHSTMVPCNTRQTLMFSATFPRHIQRLATDFLKPDYIFVAVGEIGGACKDVQQTIKKVKKFEKKSLLVKLLEEMETCDGTIVFVKHKRNADYIATYLCELDFPTTTIHGDREQPERELALRDFKTNHMKILVATSVAARGLDIKGVTNVVNYDLPSSIDEYVHRIGRTGRLGNSGIAISFFDPDTSSDCSLAPELIRILKQADQEVPQWLHDIAENRRHASTASENFNDIRTDVHSASELFPTEDDDHW